MNFLAKLFLWFLAGCLVAVAAVILWFVLVINVGANYKATHPTTTPSQKHS